VVPIDLPPLRERREDVPALIEHFLSTRQVGPARARVHPDALKALMAYSWPGNIRELANVLERAQILAENNVIDLEDLPDTIAGVAPSSEQADPRHLREVERQHVRSVLQQERGNKVHAARVLGISRRSLYRLIEKHKLEGAP
jgi:DNA-binding NtrC family response regulator